MALEALGAVSNAAGLVDLGMNICQNLLKYYQSWKDAENDIRTTYVSIENLGRSFSMLARLMSQACYDEDVLSHVEQTIVICQNGIDCLQRKLTKITSASDSKDGRRWQVEFKKQVQRTLYPFRESTLIKLKEVSNVMQGNLNIALQLLQIDVSAASTREIEDVSEKTKGLTLAVQKIDGDVNSSKKTLTGLMDSQQDQYFSTMHAWFSPLFGDFNSKQQKVYDTTARQDGMFRRLLKSETYQRWFRNHGSALWCLGPPGVGKTVLASSIIDSLQQSEHFRVGIAFIYCNYNESEKHTAENFMGVILQQICLQNAETADELISCYEAHRRSKTRPSFEELSKLLGRAAGHLPHLYLVIDAVDECPVDTRDLVFGVIRKLYPAVSLVMTSRNAAGQLSASSEEMFVEVIANEGDIQSYLQDRMDLSVALRGYLERDSQLREQIVDSISIKARGMFLLARLQLESLMTKTTLRKVKSALQSLPEELEAMYDQVMKRIQNQNPESSTLAMRALSWIHYTARPLDYAELCHALAIEPGDEAFDEEGIPELALVETVCAGLLTVQGNGTVGLVHYTAGEYFQQHSETWFPNGKIEVAQTSLIYISLSDFEDGPCPGDIQLDNRLGQYPLYSYVARFWGYHAHGNVEKHLQPLIMEFLSNELKVMSSIQALQTTKSRFPEWSQEFTKSIQGLWIAAEFKLCNVCATLVSEGANVEAKDSCGQRPLHRAAIHGCEELLEMLLDKNAELDARSDDHSRTALHWASSHGRPEAVRLLLTRGAQVNACDKRKRTPLSLAASNGNEAVIRLLLDAGADINARDSYKGIALYRAAESGHLTATRMLLDAGADIDAANIESQTALHRAADVGHLPVVTMLLERGADLKLKDYYGWTPFYRAADNGHHEVAKLLSEFAQ